MASRQELHMQFCNEAGITSNQLLDTSSQLPVPTLITKGIMLELLFLQEKKNLPCVYLSNWITKLFPDKEIPSVWTMRKSLVNLKTKKQQLQKSKIYSLELEQFLNEEYILPSKNQADRKTNGKETRSTKVLPPKQCDPTVESLKMTNYSLAKEAREWKEKFEETNDTLKKCHETIRQYNPHNAKRREKRKDEKIALQAETIRRLENEKHTTQMRLLKNSKSQTKYYQKKLHQLKEDLSNLENDDIEYLELEEQLKEEKLKTLSLQEEISILRDKVKDLESRSIILFENGKYNDKTRECIMELLSLNVGIKNIEQVMKCVFKLANIHPNRVPKHTTINSILNEAHAVSQMQLAEVLPSQEFTTLHSDGTSKFGHKYTGFQIATQDSTYTLGIREVTSGTSQVQLDTFEEILDEISTTTTEAGKMIVANIKCTMSDRANSQKCFNDMLNRYRTSILPDVVKDWEKLSDTEKESMCSMYNFFCGMHFIVGLADYSSEALRLFEEATLQTDHISESGTIRLIRTSCKAFENRGDERSGCSLPFATYLRKNGINRNPLIHFRGNRFNIVFANAGRVYYLKDKMIDFLKLWGTPNKLLKAVQEDLLNDHYIAGCKALGLIDKLITGPLWRLLESSVHILDMSDSYQKLLNFFHQCSMDSSTFITGETVPFPQIQVNKDEVWISLISASNYDNLTQQQLQTLFHTLALTTEKMLSDHLDGGQWDKPSDELKKKSVSTAKTNTISERDFAKLDRLLREKPHASHMCLEAHILFSNNKTAKWLFDKSEEERATLFKSARIMASAHKAKFKERLEKITEERIAALQKKQVEAEEKEKKVIKEKETLTIEIVLQGLWQSVADVDHKLFTLHSETAKRKALQTQLKFRKIVLQQGHNDKEVFTFSKKGVGQFNSSRLRSNLLKLIDASESEVLSHSVDIYQLVGKIVDHMFIENEQEVTYRGKVISQVSGFPSWYNVVYEKEPDIVYTFNLDEDLSNGDLKIVN